MKRQTITALLGAAALTGVLATATPASAGEAGPYPCESGDASVVGATEPNGQITFIPGLALTHCGTLGVRVYYSSVGGALWTSWKYSAYGDVTVQRDVGSPIKSEHSATRGNLKFTSYNG